VGGGGQKDHGLGLSQHTPREGIYWGWGYDPSKEGGTKRTRKNHLKVTPETTASEGGHHPRQPSHPKMQFRRREKEKKTRSPFQTREEPSSHIHRLCKREQGDQKEGKGEQKKMRE